MTLHNTHTHTLTSRPSVSPKEKKGVGFGEDLFRIVMDGKITNALALYLHTKTEMRRKYYQMIKAYNAMAFVVVAC